MGRRPQLKSDEFAESTVTPRKLLKKMLIFNAFGVKCCTFWIFNPAGVEYSDLRQAMEDGTLERLLWARLNRNLDVPPRNKEESE